MTDTPDDPWASLVRDVEALYLRPSHSSPGKGPMNRGFNKAVGEVLALIAQYRPTPDVEVG